MAMAIKEKEVEFTANTATWLKNELGNNSF